MKTTQKIKRPLDLSPPEANALMVMIESEIETTFDYGYNSYGIDPIADWEHADLYAYKLLAYKKYKEWYLETHDAKV
tara:strand:- start:294 stop:524 length:231 start_codon:yes stop_codon:yes gene_type:complete